MRAVQLLVLAKAPRPGRVKTRLCPPCTPQQAARVAAAALADTLDAVRETPAARRTLALDGALPAPAGMHVVPQRGEGLGERLAAAFADTALPGVATLLLGMDTPQVTPALLTAAVDALLGRTGADALPGRTGADALPGRTGADALLGGAAAEAAAPDAVLGEAVDGGWWALGLHDPAAAEVLRAVPMSTSRTGRSTLAALRARGLRVDPLPVLRDVDTAVDAVAVAAGAPGTRFARTVAAAVPGSPVTRGLPGSAVEVGA